MEETGRNWEQWLDEQGPALVLIARQWCAIALDAEDAVQEGFMRFWRSRHTARDPRAYLFACVRSAAYDLGRSEKSRKTREMEVGTAGPQTAQLFESLAERDEQRRIIEQAMNRLPSEQAEVLTMKLWGELTFAQIADAVGVSTNTAASRYRYGLAGLRRTLSEETVR